jgi:hypothetical protein
MPTYPAASKNQLWPLPSNFPLPNLCVQLQLPNDPYYIAQFQEQLRQMALWTNYDRDTGHNGTRAAGVWQAVIRSLQICPPTPTPPSLGEIGDFELETRQEGCLLQVKCADGSWATIYDGSLCVPNPAPGNNPPKVPPGQSGSVCLIAQANAITQIPFLLNAGDILNFTSISGAASEGNPGWFCPDGEVYFLGLCGGGKFLVSGDPLNTTAHMALIMKIGATYYPVVAGSFTVPTGVVNQIAYVQVNKAVLTANAGQFQICVTYTNNQVVVPPANVQTFDFTITDGSFQNNFPTDAPGAVWIYSQGWCNYDNGLVTPHLYHHIVERQTNNATTITRAKLTYVNGSGGSVANNVGIYVGTAPNDFSTALWFTASPQPTGQTIVDSGAVSVAVSAGHWITLVENTNGTYPAQSLAYAKLEIDYTGSAPF